MLERRRPARFVFAPNYGQWFAHHRNHQQLPPELGGAATHLDVLRKLGVDVFSRTVYGDGERRFFGGLAEEVWEGVEVRYEETLEGRDRVIAATYETRAGTLTERRRFRFSDSALVRDKRLLDDPAAQLPAFEALLAARRWRFHPERYRRMQDAVGECGLVIAGELQSPLRLLCAAASRANAAFLAAEHAGRLREILALHERAQLELVRQIVAAGVPALMAVDDLDSFTQPPRLLEEYAASFYEAASRLAQRYDSTFFVHACDGDAETLRLLASLGVDGVEGISFSAAGEAALERALTVTGDRFIFVGGMSVSEPEPDVSPPERRNAVFAAARRLFENLRPAAHRVMVGTPCATGRDVSWESLKHLRDAWLEYGEL